MHASTRRDTAGLASRRWLKAHSALVSAAVMGGLAFPAAADPTGGVVIGGGATITSSGPTTTITQTTSGAVITWEDFSVGAGEAVRFDQPDIQSVTLNRVHGTLPSDIRGEITATGSVFIENRAGVIFGAGAEINVGAAFVATTAPIRDFDVEGGHYSFDGAAPGSFVINEGSIKGATVALVAPVVDNSGFIQTNGGDVLLGAASGFTVDFVGDGLLTYEVRADSDAVLTNSGFISAGGGAVFMTAGAAGAAVSGVVSTGGTVEATRIEERGGVIVLTGGEEGRVDVTGTLSAGSPEGAGGEITVTGRAVVIGEEAEIDASGSGGSGGGGTVRIGGDFQGGGETRTSRATHIGEGATIRADGSGSGDGGTVIVWSDGATAFLGSISATGGGLGGDGGFVEVSGLDFLRVAPGALIDVSAAFGETGAILFDPRDIIIDDDPPGGGFDDAEVTADNTILAGDGTGMGDDFTISVTAITGLTGNVTLAATRDIEFAASVTSATANFTFTAGRNIDIGADFGTAGTLTFDASTSGGDIVTSAVAAIVAGSSVTYVSNDPLAVGRIGTLGPLTTGSVSLTSGGVITQLAGSSIVTSGVVSVTTTNDAVTLANAGNSFGSFTASGAAAVSVRTTTGLELGAIGASSLTVNAGGAVTQSVALALGGGALSVTATGSDITLANAANTFGTFSATGAGIVVTDSATLSIGTVSGTEFLGTAADFNVTGSLDVGAGSAVFAAIGTQGLVIGAGAGGPDFTDAELEAITAGTFEFRTSSGTIDVRTHDFTTAGRSAPDVILRSDSGLIDIGGDLSGIVDFTAIGADIDIATGGSVTGSGMATLTNAAGDMTQVGGAGDAVATTFDLSGAELGRVAFGDIVVDSQNGTLTLAALDIGSDSLSLLAGTGLLDITGNVTAGSLTATAGDVDVASGVTVTLGGGTGVAAITQGGFGGLTFGGAGDASASTFELTDAELDRFTAVLSFDAATQDVVFDTVTSTRAFTVSNAGAITFAGASTFGSTLTLTGASISDGASGTVGVTGLAGLTAAGAVTLDNAGNAFASVGAAGSTVSLRDSSGALDLAGIAGSNGAGSTAQLTVRAVGAITDSAPLAVSGTSSFQTSATADVTLDLASNLLGTIAIPAAGDVVVVSDGAITFSTVTARSLTVTGTDVDLLGAVTLDGGSGTASFSNAEGDAVALGGLASAVADTFDLSDLDLSNLTAGTLAIDSRGGSVTVAQISLAGVDLAIDANQGGSNGAVTFTGIGTTTVADLTVTGASSVTQATGPLIVTGTADVASLGVVTLGAVGNQFGTFGASGTAITVTDSGALELGTIAGAGGGSTSLLAITAGGAVTQAAGATISADGVTVTAPGAAVTLANAGNSLGSFLGTGGLLGAVTLLDAGDLSLGPIIASNLTVTAADVDIDAGVIVFGTATFANAAGDAITIGATAADAAAGTFELTDTDLSLLFAGTLATTTGGATVVDSLSFANTLRMTSGGAVSFEGGPSALGALVVAGSSSISQAAGSTVSVAGLADLTSSGTVVLAETGNSFATVAGTAGAFTLAETGGFIATSLAATAGGIDIDVTGGAFTATGPVTAVGTADFTASDGVTLAGGSAATLAVQSTDVEFGTAIFTVGGGTGPASFVNTGGDGITLGGAGDASSATFEISALERTFLSAGSISTSTTSGPTLVDGFSIGTLDIAGGAGVVSFVGLPSSFDALTISASSGVTQTAAISVTGQTSISSAGDVILGTASNDLTDVIGTAASFLISETDGVDLGALTATTGAIDVTSTGVVGVDPGVSVDAAGALSLTGSGGVSASTSSVLEGASIALSGASVAAGTVTATAGLVDIDSTAGGVTLGGVVTATGGAVDIDAVGGGILVGAAISSTTDIDLAATGAINVAAGITADAAGALSLASSAGAVVAEAGSVLEGASVTVSGLSTMTRTVTATGGFVDIDATAGSVTLLGTTSATGAVSVDAVGGDIALAGQTVTADSDGAGGEALSLAAAGNAVSGAGATLRGGTVSVDAADIAIGTATSTAGALQLNATGATGITVSGALAAATLLDIDAVGGQVSVGGGVSAGAVDVDTTGPGVVGADVIFTSPVVTTGLGGTTGNIEVTTAGGDITALSTLDANGVPGSVLLSSGTGAISTVDVTADGDVVMAGGAAVTTGAVTAGSTIGLLSTGASVSVGGPLLASGADVGGVSVAIGAATFVTLMEVTAAGDLAVGAGTRIALQDNLTVTGGSIYLSAGDSFGFEGGPRELPAGLVLTAIPGGPISGTDINSAGNVVFDLGQGFTIRQMAGATTPALTVVLRDNIAAPALPALPAPISSFGEFRILVDQGVIAIGNDSFVDAAVMTGFNPFTYQSSLTDQSELLRVEGHLGLVGPAATLAAPSFHVQNTSSVPNEGTGTLVAGEGRLGGLFAAISLFGSVNGRDSTNVALGGFVQINTRDPSLPLFQTIPFGTANGCVILQIASCQAFGLLVPLLDFEDGDLLNIRFVDPDEEEDDPFTNRGDEEEWN